MRIEMQIDNIFLQKLFPKKSCEYVDFDRARGDVAVHTHQAFAQPYFRWFLLLLIFELRSRKHAINSCEHQNYLRTK